MQQLLATALLNAFNKVPRVIYRNCWICVKFYCCKVRISHALCVGYVVIFAMLPAIFFLSVRMHHKQSVLNCGGVFYRRCKGGYSQ